MGTEKLPEDGITRFSKNYQAQRLAFPLEEDIFQQVVENRFVEVSAILEDL